MANCPGKNTLAVAELAIGLLIAADRRIVDAAAALRNGSWQKKEFGKARGLAGRTLGILGFGAIGRAVFQRARALEMSIITWSPLDLTAQQAKDLGVGYFNTPEEVAARADAVTIHLALTPETKHLVGKKFLDAMKPGAILINTSRGPLVNTAALRGHRRKEAAGSDGRVRGGAGRRRGHLRRQGTGRADHLHPAHRRLDRSSGRRHRRRNRADRKDLHRLRPSLRSGQRRNADVLKVIPGPSAR